MERKNGSSAPVTGASIARPVVTIGAGYVARSAVRTLTPMVGGPVALAAVAVGWGVKFLLDSLWD